MLSIDIKKIREMRLLLIQIMIAWSALAACKNPEHIPEPIATNNDNMNPTNKTGLDTATLGNGCFWCTEAIFESLKGVESATSGYSGGHTENPDYKAVCTGETGHAE